MTIEQYAKLEYDRAAIAMQTGDHLAAAKILEALAKEVKAHGMAMKHGVGKPFTAPRA